MNNNVCDILTVATNSILDSLVVKNHLARVRKSHGITQTNLARQVGCSKNTISLIETGKQMPTLTLAFRIVCVLCCSFTDVFYPAWINV